MRTLLILLTLIGYPLVSSAQDQLIERQTYAYFAARDGQKYQEAYALFSPLLKQTLPFEHWKSMSEKFNAQAGAVLSRKVKKITWYKDPPSAEPGVYAAADYVSQFAHIKIHCGYLVWHQQNDGSFLLMHEEENYIGTALQQKLKPAELKKARAELGC